MYLPRNLLSQLYTHLVRTTHPLSPPVLLLVSLDPDALCACRILTALLKRDYIPHKVQPVAGYSELAKAGQDLVRPLTRQHGGDGGVVVCLGVGGLVDLEEVLGLDGGEEEASMADHGVEVWVVDARRPWNLQNVFGFGAAAAEVQQDTTEPIVKRRRGVDKGKLLSTYNPGRGGVIVFDDGDIEQELNAERDAFCVLQDMPEVEEEDDDDLGSDSEDEEEISQDSDNSNDKKRKSWSDEDEDVLDSGDDGERPRQRRRSNSGTPIPSSPRERTPRQETFEFSNHPSSSQVGSPSGVVPSSPPRYPKQPSARTLRRRLLRLRRKHESVLQAYYSLGTSYAEPMSSMLYSLASELGREDNDLLWLAIIGTSSRDLYGHDSIAHSSNSSRRLTRSAMIHQVLQDEVRRLNPIPVSDIAAARERDMDSTGGVIPTHARSPTDTSIRLSPEPRFLLIRHWSLYDSMLHSPYLSTRLHIWSDSGRKRLHKLLAKMGVSLAEAAKGYTHMDMELKRGLRQRLLKFAPIYGLDGLVPPADGGRTAKEGWGYVRCWGWKACLSALDVAVIAGAILEVGTEPLVDSFSAHSNAFSTPVRGGSALSGSYNARIRALPTPPMSADGSDDDAANAGLNIADPDWTTHRFFAAYDALSPSGSTALGQLLANIPTAQHLHRAILRTGSALVAKHQIRHLRAFRMGVVKEGPDAPLFCHPGALVKLAGWVAEAVGVLEAEKGRKERGALVLGALDQGRGVYVVVGLGGGGVGERVKSKAELREKEEKKKAKLAEKEKKKLERERKREDRKRRKRERDEANGIFRDEDEEMEDSEEESESDSSDDSDDDSDDEETKEKKKKRGYGLNRFGAAFQEVVEETGARVRIDSFEHSVVEVKKEDFSGFLEALSLKSVVG